MRALIPFPTWLHPEVFSLDAGFATLSLRWYALAYIVGLLIGWRMALRAIRAARLWPGGVSPMTAAEAEGLFTSVILGVIVGGRLGFVFFYAPQEFLAAPLSALYVWEGGMSFHGGMVGVVVAAALFCWRNRIRLLSAADALALGTPIGLLLGRLANFVNAELWGRPTHLPWGVVFPGERAQDCPLDWVGPCGRHPSQLYEAGIEGILLGALLLWVAWRTGWLSWPGRLTGLFLAGYGTARFVVEFFRLADAQFIGPGNPYGHVVSVGAWGLTMGQVLSLPMVLLGLAMIALARQPARRREAPA